ncbi:penicillin-binding transpeptidase domain-containing protein [Halalkalibaculum sp. DA3122]|uniref:penicillin-binding transpeptidase domain-containing protein n=1 Tax=unclassified Halalkalibaculum TaxID=2964617 RepID=UPI003754FDC2
MPEERSAIMGRLFALFGLLLLVPCAIGFQLFRINFMEGEKLRALWNEQAIDYISIPAQRGNIYDHDGTLLATNSAVYKAAIDPRLEGLTQNDIYKVCKTLSDFTGVSAQAYRKKIDRAPSRSRYVVLAEGLNTEAYLQLNALDIRALILEEEYQRRYNFGTLAAHLLGFVNHEARGVIGLEHEYDNQLKGTDGQQQVRRDRNGRIFAYVGAPRKLPKQGYSLHTTIDSHIQAILEEELKAGIDRTKSNYGSAIVMDPRTGAIKAMANFPTFNPNTPASSKSENRRNYAISDMIEPGSTFKLVTAIASVEQEVVSFDETFETPEDGEKLIHGQMMRDHDPLGNLRLDEVFEQSSNIATAEIAMRLSPNVFYQYARNLGFGTPTNIDLPNEESGRLQKPYEWSQVTLPWMAIGYEVQVTPIQLLQAYAAFANNGKMMRPYIVEKITDSEENIVRRNNPVTVRQIADKQTLDKLQPVFEDVVADSGTARWVKVEGLEIAGKTGTAQKYIDGRYQAAYRASFVGFFPAENPKYVCLVVLDEPQTSIYGGYTAGVIFKQTAIRIAGLDREIQRTLEKPANQQAPLVHVPDVQNMSIGNARAVLESHNIDFELEGSGKWISKQTPAPGNTLTGNKVITLTAADTPAAQADSTVSKDYARIPDVGGLDMRRAAVMINSRGFNIKMIGSGTVYTQFPRPGDLMKKGRTITVRGKAKSLETLAGK